MQIKSPQDIKSFLIKHPPNILGVLIYGPDNGLVNLRAKSLKRNILGDDVGGMQNISITPDLLKDNPATIRDEFCASSLMGGKKVIEINNATNGLTSILKGTLSEMPENISENAFLLVTADNLTLASSLRKFFEQSKIFASIACYNDDSRNLETIVHTELKKRGVDYENEIPAFLAKNCLGDRMIIMQEIKKILFYRGEDKNKISLQEVMSLSGETTESSFQDIASALLDNDLNSLHAHLAKSFLQGVNTVSILRAVKNYFTRINLVLSAKQDGNSEEQAVNNLKPRIFFKDIPVFKRHLLKISKNGGVPLISKVIKLLYQAELDCKNNNFPQEMMCRQHLMQMAYILSR